MSPKLWSRLPPARTRTPRNLLSSAQPVLVQSAAARSLRQSSCLLRSNLALAQTSPSLQRVKVRVLMFPLLLAAAIRLTHSPGKMARPLQAGGSVRHRMPS
jgi:hypothetical protein